MTDFLGEIAMLKHVGAHKHVIRLVGCCTKQAPLVALLEHAPRGDLLSLLRAARGKTRIDQSTSATKKPYNNGRIERPSEADSKKINTCKIYISRSKRSQSMHFLIIFVIRMSR